MDELDEILRLGEQAVANMEKSIEQVMALAHAFAAVQREAMLRSNSKSPHGGAYTSTMSRLLESSPGLNRTPGTDRLHYVKIARCEVGFLAWFNGLAADDRLRRSNSPQGLWAAYQRSKAPDRERQARRAPTVVRLKLIDDPDHDGDRLLEMVADLPTPDEQARVLNRAHKNALAKIREENNHSSGRKTS